MKTLFRSLLYSGGWHELKIEKLAVPSVFCCDTFIFICASERSLIVVSIRFLTQYFEHERCVFFLKLYNQTALPITAGPDRIKVPVIVIPKLILHLY